MGKNVMEDYRFDGVEPDNSIPEDAEVNQRGLRYKALLLLLIFLIPTVLVIVELLTGSLSGWWVKTIQPHLPQLDRIISF
jgi:hypothetical protein